MPNASSSSRPSASSTSACVPPPPRSFCSSVSVCAALATPAEVCLRSGSSIFSSRSSQPGATRRFSASSRARTPSSHSLMSASASEAALSRCVWRAVHDAITSSGCTARPVDERMNCGPESGAWPLLSGIMDEGGRDGGKLLYVYGSDAAVGRDTNGDTVRGTCARSG